MRELYLQQGTIPKNVQNKVEQASAPPVKESSAPSFKESSVPPLRTLIGQTEGEKKSDRKKSKKVGKNNTMTKRKGTKRHKMDKILHINVLRKRKQFILHLCLLLK